MLLAAVLPRVPALSGGFIWLDHTHLEGGQALVEPGAWFSAFTHGFAGTGFYRPLVSLSLSLDAAIAPTAFFFRTMTLAWHAMASLMVLLVSGVFGLSRKARLGAALLFAVHPVSGLVSNAIAFRSESMLAVSLLALLYAHAKKKPVLAGFALLCAVFTKETGAVLGPLFVISLEVLNQIDRTSIRTRTARRISLWMAEALFWAAAISLRAIYAPAWRGSFESLSGSQALGTRLATLGKSLGVLAFPFDTHICDAFPVTELLAPAALLGAIGAVGLAALCWQRRAPSWLLVLSLLPSLSLVPLTRFWSPHYLYVPLAFASIQACSFFAQMGQRAVLAGGLLILLWAGLCFQDSFRYRSDVALFAPEVEHEPRCREAHFYLADSARLAQDWGAAADHLERSLKSDPGMLSYVDRAAALENLGAVEWRQQRWQEAKSTWSVALAEAKDPMRKRQITHNLAVLALSRGNAAEALSLLEAECQRTDALPESLLVQKQALKMLNRKPDELRVRE